VDGYNSGRAYYLKASSEQECADLISVLSSSAQIARKAKEAKTRFEESQERVRIAYRSGPCQGFTATMIIAVPLSSSPRQLSIVVLRLSWSKAAHPCKCLPLPPPSRCVLPARLTPRPVLGCCPCARQNFVLNAVATQYNDVLNPSNAKNPEVIELARNLDAIDTFFTALFTTELLVNLYAHWSPST
jgi:hypothetical protein